MKSKAYQRDRPDAWLSSVMRGSSTVADMPTVRCTAFDLMESQNGVAKRVCTKRPGHDGDHAYSSWSLEPRTTPATLEDLVNLLRVRLEQERATKDELLQTLYKVRDSLRGLVAVPPETCKYEIDWLNQAIAKAEGR